MRNTASFTPFGGESHGSLATTTTLAWPSVQRDSCCIPGSSGHTDRLHSGRSLEGHQEAHSGHTSLGSGAGVLSHALHSYGPRHATWCRQRGLPLFHLVQLGPWKQERQERCICRGEEAAVCREGADNTGGGSLSTVNGSLMSSRRQPICVITDARAGQPEGHSGHKPLMSMSWMQPYVNLATILTGAAPPTPPLA